MSLSPPSQTPAYFAPSPTGQCRFDSYIMPNGINITGAECDDLLSMNPGAKNLLIITSVIDCLFYFGTMYCFISCAAATVIKYRKNESNKHVRFYHAFEFWVCFAGFWTSFFMFISRTGLYPYKSNPLFKFFVFFFSLSSACHLWIPMSYLFAMAESSNEHKMHSADLSLTRFTKFGALLGAVTSVAQWIMYLLQEFAYGPADAKFNGYGIISLIVTYGTISVLSLFMIPMIYVHIRNLKILFDTKNRASAIDINAEMATGKKNKKRIARKLEEARKIEDQAKTEIKSRIRTINVVTTWTVVIFVFGVFAVCIIAIMQYNKPKLSENKTQAILLAVQYYYNTNFYMNVMLGWVNKIWMGMTLVALYVQRYDYMIIMIWQWFFGDDSLYWWLRRTYNAGRSHSSKSATSTGSTRVETSVEDDEENNLTSRDGNGGGGGGSVQEQILSEMVDVDEEFVFQNLKLPSISTEENRDENLIETETTTDDAASVPRKKASSRAKRRRHPVAK